MITIIIRVRSTPYIVQIQLFWTLNPLRFSGRLILLLLLLAVIKDYRSAFDTSNCINSAWMDPFLLVLIGRISCNVICC